MPGDRPAADPRLAEAEAYVRACLGETGQPLDEDVVAETTRRVLKALPPVVRQSRIDGMPACPTGLRPTAS